MEKLRISWTLSPSTFVEKQQVYCKLNGGAAAQVGVDLASSIDTVELNFNAGDSIVIFIRTVGDNNTYADSASSAAFLVANLEVVKAAGAPSITWVSHMP